MFVTEPTFIPKLPASKGKKEKWTVRRFCQHKESNLLQGKIVLRHESLVCI